MKTRFSRENFTRKNNHLNIILQDGDGNIKIMPLKDIYDAIQQAKTASEKHTDYWHKEAIKHTDYWHGEAKKHTNTKTEKCIRSDRPVKIQFAAGHCGGLSHTSNHNCGHGNRHMTLYGVKGGSTPRFGHEMDLYPGREGGVDHPRYAEKFMLTPV